MDDCDWGCTKKALKKLEKALDCGVCDKLLQEPCTLGSCDHLFCRSCVRIHLGNACPVCHAPAWVKDLQVKRELASVVSLYDKLCTMVNHDASLNTDKTLATSGGTDRNLNIKINDQSTLNDSTPNNESVVAVEKSPTRKALHTRNVSPRAQVEHAGGPQKFGKMSSKTRRHKQTIGNKAIEKHLVLQKNERNKMSGTSSSSSENELIDPISVYDFIPSPKRPKPAAKKRVRKPNPRASKKQRVAAANRKWFHSSIANKKAVEESESGFDSERSVRHVSFSIDTDLSKSSAQDSSSPESMDISSQDEMIPRLIADDCSATVSSTQESGYMTGSTPSTSKNSLFNKSSTSSKDNKTQQSNSRSRAFKKTPTNSKKAPDTSQTQLQPPATRTSKRKASTNSHNNEDPDVKTDKTLNTRSSLTEGTSLPKARQEVPQRPLSEKSPSQTHEVTETDAPSLCKKRRSKNQGPIQDDGHLLNGQEETRSLRSTSKPDSSAETNLLTSQTSRKKMKQDSRKKPTIAATQQQTPQRDGKSSQEAGKRQVRTPTSSDEKLRSLRQTKTSPQSNGPPIKRNKRGETPLHIAAIKGNIDATRQLLEDGANPNAKDNAGWTPLHEACNHGHLTIVALLLDYGALINTPGFEHDSPLHDAVMNHRLDVVKLLLERGSSLDVRAQSVRQHDHTITCLICRCKRITVCIFLKLLLERGSSLDVRNKHGLTPADYAKSELMKKALKTKPLVTVATTNMAAVPLTSSHNMNQSVVLLGTGLKDPERKQLQSCAKLLGGRVVSEFGPDVTHLIASCNQDNLCIRTMKYLNAILVGVWVVSLNWLKECLHSKARASEIEYEMKGTLTLPLSSGAKKGRRNAEQQLPGLLDGCHFYMYSTFSPPTPSKQEIIQLVKNGGGAILNRQPKPDDDIIQASTTIPYHAQPGSQLATCSHYILHDHIDGRAPPRVRTGKLCTAPVSWLMDCISQFELIDVPE